MIFNPILPGSFSILNIQGWTIWYTPSILSSEIAIDLKFGVALVHESLSYFWMTSSNLINLVQNLKNSKIIKTKINVHQNFN